MNSKYYNLAAMVLTTSASVTAITKSSVEDYASLMGSEQALNMATLQDSTSAALDTSGCITSPVDSSGIAGWYAAPEQIQVSAPAPEPGFGKELVHAANVIVALSNETAFIYKVSGELLEFQSTVTIVGGAASDIAIAPAGDEIIITTAAKILVIKQATPGSWLNPIIAQDLAPESPTPSQISYSEDGNRLFISTQESNKPVYGLQKAVSGEWTPMNQVPPGKFSATSFTRPLVFTNNRLLFLDQTFLSFSHNASGYTFAQAFPGAILPESSLEPIPQGVAYRSNSSMVVYNLGPSGFVRGPGGLGSFDLSTLGVSNPRRLIVEALNQSCVLIRITAPTPSVQGLGGYLLPKGNTSAQVVSGPWGIIAAGNNAIAPALYWIRRDRFFGGQNTDPGQNPGTGTGGFE